MIHEEKGASVLSETRVKMVCISKAFMCLSGPMGPYPVRNYIISVFIFAILISILISALMFAPYYFLSFVPIAFSATALAAFLTCAFVDPGIVPRRHGGQPQEELKEPSLFPITSPAPIHINTSHTKPSVVSDIDINTNLIQQPIAQNTIDVSARNTPATIPTNEAKIYSGQNDTVEPGFNLIPTKPRLVPARFCKICNIYQLDYVKHCKLCKTCTLELDHHCPVVGTCIGARNKVYFVMMLTFAQTGIVVIIVSAILGVVFLTMPDDQPDTKWILAVIATSIGVTLYIFLLVFFFLAIAGKVYTAPVFKRIATVLCGRPNAWRPHTILYTKLKRERWAGCIPPFCWIPLPESLVHKEHYGVEHDYDARIKTETKMKADARAANCGNDISVTQMHPKQLPMAEWRPAPPTDTTDLTITSSGVEILNGAVH